MLTLEQLYNLGLSENVDIFNGLTLPLNSPINRTTLINTILMNCGLNIPMYADPNVMASAVTVWSSRNQYTFEHVANILTAKYSPIENKDAYETVTIEHERTLKDNTIGSTKKNEGLTSTYKENNNETNNETHAGTDTTTDTTSAYNSSTYEPDNQTKLEHGEKIDGTRKSDRDSQNSGTKNTNSTLNNDKNVAEKEKTTNMLRQHGNIGITSNNDLQTQEYKMLSEYNPYTFLAGLFENELTLFVY